MKEQASYLWSIKFHYCFQVLTKRKRFWHELTIAKMVCAIFDMASFLGFTLLSHFMLKNPEILLILYIIINYDTTFSSVESMVFDDIMLDISSNRDQLLHH